jgi:hypothetical protein
VDDELKQTLFRLTAVKLEVASRALGMSRSAIYNAARRGDLPIIRIGGSIRVPTAPLRKLLGLEQEAA